MFNQNEGNTLQNELLTVKEVAAYLRVSPVTAWRWCKQGVIPAFRIGRTWRLRRDDLLELENTSSPISLQSDARSSARPKTSSAPSSTDDDPSSGGTT